MYTGNERLVFNGKPLPFTMLDFWRWGFSNVRHNTQRGTFANYLVKCALESAGIPTRAEIGTGFEPYDLEGPTVAATGKPCRIEVKSAGILQSWGKSSRIAFSIAPARTVKNGDVKHADRPLRNNDLYVFCYFFADDPGADILDLRWWQFYVVATWRIESDKRLKNQRTVSLKSVERLCRPLLFSQIADEVKAVCAQLSAQ